MTDWIDDLAHTLRADQQQQNSQHERALIVEEHWLRYWDELRHAAEGYVHELNVKIGATAQFSYNRSGQGFLIMKEPLPRVTIECHPDLETHTIRVTIAKQTTSGKRPDPHRMAWKLTGSPEAGNKGLLVVASDETGIGRLLDGPDALASHILQDALKDTIG